MKKALVIILYIAFVFSILGQDKTDKKPISYEEYIEIIKEKLPELEQNQIYLELAENNVDRSWGTYDPLLNSTFSGIGKKTYPDSSSSEVWYSSGFKSDTSVTATAPSGTRLTLGFEYSQMYSNGMNSGFNYSTMKSTETEFLMITRDSIVKVSVSQPLIRNWFGFLDRYAMKDAKMKLEVEKIKKLENDKAIFNYYKKMYFFWYQWDQILNYLKTTIDNAKRLEAQTAQKLKAGIVENDEYQRTRYSVFMYQQQYNQTVIEYKRILNELSAFIDVEKRYPGVVSDDNNNPGETKDDFTLLYETAKNSKIDFVEFEETNNSKILNLNRENLEYLKKISLNKTLPQLNIFGNIDIKFHEYYYNPEGHPDAGEESDTDYRFYYGNTVFGQSENYMDNYEDEINKYPNLDFVVGIEFSYPLGNFKARSDYKESKLRLKELMLQYDISKRNYKTNMNNLITSIELMKDTIDKKNQSIEALNSQYNTEKRKSSQARIELRNLLDTENTKVNEEINLMKSKAQVITLYLDYLQLIK